MKRILRTKVWGGVNLKKRLKIHLPSEENYGESWELSVQKGSQSVIDNGVYQGHIFEELLKVEPQKWLGKNTKKAVFSSFPFLLKFLDVNDRLSLQVHPPNTEALKEHNSLGKAECWSVLWACEKAKIVLGAQTSFYTLHSQEINSKLNLESWQNYFKIYPIKTGDFIYIAPGTVHASVEGSFLVCEIQQNSNITYRLYDFDRFYQGKKRELHVEKALQTMDPNKEKESFICSIEKQSLTLIDNEYFRIDQHLGNNTCASKTFLAQKSFSILCVLEAQSDSLLKWEKEDCVVHTGEIYFLAPGLGWTANNLKKFLLVYPK